MQCFGRTLFNVASGMVTYLTKSHFTGRKTRSYGMKTIMNVELSLGYQHWKKLMLENESFRQKNQMNLLAYGHEEGNENKVWVVMDVPSMEHMVGIMNKPEMIKIREEAGAILASQELIKLVE